MSRKLGRPISRRAYAASLLTAVLALGGCMARSIAPAVDGKDRVVDSRLVGRWQSDRGTETAVITARDSDYAVLYTDDKGEPGAFVGRLGRLGGRWVLDLAPQASGVQASDSYKGLLLPLHTFLLIDSIGARMRVSAVKSDSVEGYLEREPSAVAHVKVDNEVVLTAPTPELRAFLERYVTRPGVLEPQLWTRQ